MRYETLGIGQLTVNDVLIQGSVSGGGLSMQHTGDEYFVHATRGIDGPGRGKTAAKPYASLDYALGKCTANNDDVIHLCAGHTETITGAGGITLDKAGVTIIGHGRYDARPTFLMDGAATVSALVTAANVSISNCRFNPGHADINYAFLVTAKGFRMEGCKFDEITTNENWVDVIHVSSTDNDADGLELINNEINLTDSAHVTAIDLLKDINDAKIIGNRITGDFDATPYAPIYMAVAEVPKNILIAGNMIHNQHDGNAAVGISVACTTATGWIVHNIVGHKDVDGSTPILAGAAGLMVAENYVSSVLGTASGYLYPAADDGAS
jgi:hypothetical protein